MKLKRDLIIKIAIRIAMFAGILTAFMLGNNMKYDYEQKQNAATQYIEKCLQADRRVDEVLGQLVCNPK